MKCPTPKCKGGKRITTRRTFDEGYRIRRQRHCPVCKKYFDTFEYSEASYTKMVNEYEARIRNLTATLNSTRATHGELTGTILSLLHQVGVEPKSAGNGKTNGKAKKKSRGVCLDCGGVKTGPGDLCEACQDFADIQA